MKLPEIPEYQTAFANQSSGGAVTIISSSLALYECGDGQYGRELQTEGHRLARWITAGYELTPTVGELAADEIGVVIVVQGLRKFLQWGVDMTYEVPLLLAEMGHTPPIIFSDPVCKNLENTTMLYAAGYNAVIPELYVHDSADAQTAICAATARAVTELLITT